MDVVTALGAFFFMVIVGAIWVSVMDYYDKKDEKPDEHKEGLKEKPFVPTTLDAAEVKPKAPRKPRKPRAPAAPKATPIVRRRKALNSKEKAVVDKKSE